MKLMEPTQKEALINEEEMNEMEEEKCCGDCKTTKTPLWRTGPSGPKSLCNACGIKYRKRKSAMVGLKKGTEKRKGKSPSTTSCTTTAAASAATGGGRKGSVGRGKGGDLGEDLRVRVMALGKEVVLLRRQKKRSPMKRQRRRKLGEVEQAALLLMSLSCASVFA
ncbi:hypothetical protein LguiB_006325 [Lonicera macranthoides]